MAVTKQDRTTTCRGAFLRMPTVAALLMAMTLPSQQVAEAQNFSVLHTFDSWKYGSHAVDGAAPTAGLTMDQTGNLYGTTFSGGYQGGECNGALGVWGCGTVFRLSRNVPDWFWAPLYLFRGGGDGRGPEARVTFGPDGDLYGTTVPPTFYSRTALDWDWGTVYKLSPRTGNITTIHRFLGGPDGVDPGSADLIFDHAGNLYGTTRYGGYRGGSCGPLGGCGIVYELSPSDGGWTENIIYEFKRGSDGFFPASGVIFDQEGNLYGVADGGAYGYGTVFQLKPTGSGWIENTLHSFALGDGAYPAGGLIFDQSGNLYGTTSSGGQGLGGTVFELRPSGGGWSFSTLYSFQGEYGPFASLTMDSIGDLYGTTSSDGLYNFGNVFKVTPQNGGWTYTDLHDFTGYGDGFAPTSTVLIDSEGNLYGTASLGGGMCDCGVVWEITP